MDAFVEGSLSATCPATHIPPGSHRLASAETQTHRHIITGGRSYAVGSSESDMAEWPLQPQATPEQKGRIQAQLDAISLGPSDFESPKDGGGWMPLPALADYSDGGDAEETNECQAVVVHKPAQTPTRPAPPMWFIMLQRGEESEAEPCDCATPAPAAPSFDWADEELLESAAAEPPLSAACRAVTAPFSKKRKASLVSGSRGGGKPPDFV